MSFCWSSWTKEDFSFSTFLKFQDQNVEWCRCTRVVLILLWSIYFFWVFGLLLYSVLVDDLEFSQITRFKSSSNLAGWEEYDDRAHWPNSSNSVGSLYHRGLLSLFNGALIWKMNCGDSITQVSDLRRKEMCYDQGVRTKIPFKDGASHAQKYLSLMSESFISSTIIVHLVSFVTNQNALELVLVAGSLSSCYNLTCGSIRKTTDWDIKRIGIPMFLISSEFYKWYDMTEKQEKQEVWNKYTMEDDLPHELVKASLNFKSFNSSTNIVQIVSFIANQNALELTIWVGSLSNWYDLMLGLLRKDMVRTIKCIGWLKIPGSIHSYGCNLCMKPFKLYFVYVFDLVWIRDGSLRCILIKLKLGFSSQFMYCLREWVPLKVP